MRLKFITLGLAAAFYLLSGFRPAALPYTPGTPFSDAVTSHLPAAQFLRYSVLENDAFPLWRETIMAGQPFAANPLNKTAYPLQWLTLLFPPALHLDLMIILHLCIAGVGMWLLARALNLREAACAFAALAYVLAPRMIGHLGAGHLDLIYALAWFPWLLWSVRKLIYTHTISLRNTCLLALFAALTLLADVRLSLFAFALAASFTLYDVIRLKRLRLMLRFIPSVAFFVLLTLSLLLPLLRWQPYLSRAGLTAREAGVFSLAPAQALGLLLPPRTGNVEMLTYLGLPVLVLALLGAVTARQGFWAVAAGVAALYALGINAPLWTTLVQVFPPLLMFRVPSRAWFVVALVVPLLAGYGVQWLLTSLEGRQFRRGTLVALIGTVVAVISGGFLALTVPVITGLSILVGGGGIGILCLLALAGRLRGERLALALLLVLFLDMALFGRGWLEWRTQEAWLPPGQVQLAQRLTELNAYRIYSPTYSLQQQVAEEYHLRLFGGVDPFQLKGVVAAVEQGGGIQDGGYSVVMPPLQGDAVANANRDAVPDTNVLGRWGVTHVVSAYALDVPDLRLVDSLVAELPADNAPVYIYENLDPALTNDFEDAPAWVEGWSGLPDRQTVQQLNQSTGIAALISGVAFIVLTGVAIFAKGRD